MPMSMWRLCLPFKHFYLENSVQQQGAHRTRDEISVMIPMSFVFALLQV